MSFQKMYGLRGPWGRTAVLQLTYELRPKWNKNKKAKMPFLGRTLGRGPTNMKKDKGKFLRKAHGSQAMIIGTKLIA